MTSEKQRNSCEIKGGISELLRILFTELFEFLEEYSGNYGFFL